MDSSLLRSFVLEKVLSEDLLTHSFALLGTLDHRNHNDRGSVERSQAILRVERTSLDAGNFGKLLEKTDVEVLETTDIYTSLIGQFGREDEPYKTPPDIKIDIICPATELHIRKYSTQDMFMVQETPEKYERIVQPFIEAFPRSRTKWIDDVLSGASEADKVLYSCDEFVILPDMKWDLRTMSALYLVAIARSGQVKSLRDLEGKHLRMLKAIRHEGQKVARERWGILEGALRMYVHYQPSYYHFHVHIVNANQYGLRGMNVGQAHLLDNVISLIELDSNIFQKMTLTYGLGSQHPLSPLLTI